MKYAFQRAENLVSASVVELTDNGYVHGVAYLSDNTLGAYSQVEEDVLWTGGEIFSTEHEALAAAKAAKAE